MSYQRPPLTKALLRGDASEADLPIESGQWLAQHRIDLVAGRVVTLDAKARTTELSGGRELPYERTARDGVLAAGDVCLAANLAAGRALRVEHWGDALTQGEIAGKTAAGASGGWDAVPGFWSTIGQRTLKYAAWGDGYDATHLDHHASGGFTVRYGSRGRLVGVLTHEADGDYEHGSEQIAEGAPWDF